MKEGERGKRTKNWRLIAAKVSLVVERLPTGNQARSENME